MLDSGRFIAVEGTDGSGKATQIAKLAARLLDNRYRVTQLAFPQYELSMFGELAGQMLRGDFGEMDRIHPRLATLPYTNDRLVASPQIRQKLGEGGIVLADRFTLSAQAHQAARLLEEERMEFVEWVEHMEHEVLGIPRPDMYLFLRVPTDVSMELISKKAKRKYLGGDSADQLEADRIHQIGALKMYDTLAELDRRVRVIECTRDGKLLGIDEIHKRVWLETDKFLNSGNYSSATKVR